MKARIRKTGEVVEVISYSGFTIRDETLDTVAYIDSQGKEHPRESLNFYWDFEAITDEREGLVSTIDWHQARIEAAISAMQAIISKNDDYTYKELAVHAVGYAEALVKELKKKKSLSREEE